ncbi:hypothetical protein D3C75_904670 [compost metagenome]
MALGGEAGEVFLCRAKAGHVGAGLGGVQVHEQAAAVARRFASHRGDIGQHALAVVDVGPAHEGGGDALGPVREDHLLGPDDQGDVARACAQPLDRLIQRRRARGAGVLDIGHGDAGQAQRAQGDLAAHRVLALQHGLAGVGEPRRLDVADLSPRVGQGLAHGLGGQALHRVGGAFAQGGHRHAGDEDRRRHAVGRRRWTMRKRAATKARSARQALPAGFRPLT